MEIHKEARYFPMMTGDDFAELVADIKEHGLLEPIVRYQGRVLDGQNRLRACAKAKVKPRFISYAGNGALAYVVSKNLKRRHLSYSQRCALASEIALTIRKQLKTGEIEVSGPEGAEAARTHKAPEFVMAGRMTGVQTRRVSDAVQIKSEAPDLFREMKKDSTTVNNAMSELRMRSAAKGVHRDNARKDAQNRQSRTREVKAHLAAVNDFLDACREFAWRCDKGSLDNARKVAEHGSFSPEAKRFVKEKYKVVRKELSEVEKYLKSTEQALSGN